MVMVMMLYDVIEFFYSLRPIVQVAPTLGNLDSRDDVTGGMVE